MFNNYLTPEIGRHVVAKRMAAVVAEAYDHQIVMQTHLALGNDEEAAAFAERIAACNIAVGVLAAEASRWEEQADGDDGGPGNEDS